MRGDVYNVYGESLIRCIVKGTYIVCGCMLEMPRKRAIGRLRPKSSKIINKNSCFESVFDSVWKSDFPVAEVIAITSRVVLAT